MVGKCILLGFLFLFAWMDLKKSELSLPLLGVCAAVGVLVSRSADALSWADLLGGLCIGGTLMLFALASKESIGLGDGLLFCATGVYLGLRQNLLLLFCSVMLCAIFGSVLLLGRKCSRK
ncbi:MAG: prepilin peptidase [Lachnospiraceae bacterium]|nr:prepilin peptidase [Lachnospiraceae bacterium]